MRQICKLWVALWIGGCDHFYQARVNWSSPGVEYIRTVFMGKPTNENFKTVLPSLVLPIWTICECIKTVNPKLWRENDGLFLYIYFDIYKYEYGEFMVNSSNETFRFNTSICQ